MEELCRWTMSLLDIVGWTLSAGHCRAGHHRAGHCLARPCHGVLQKSSNTLQFNVAGAFFGESTLLDDFLDNELLIYQIQFLSQVPTVDSTQFE